jgi:drug/metabolite transporter (DMT)-like permease
MKARLNTADLLLLVVAAIWGGSYLALKMLGETLSWTHLLPIRFVPAAAFLWLFWLRKRTRFKRAELLIGLYFGISQVVIMSLETNSVNLTSATNGGLIISMAIVITPLFEGVLKRRWLPPSFFLASVLTVVGVGLLIVGNGFVPPNLGDLLMVIAALLRGLHFAFAGKLTQGKPYSSLNLTVLQVTTSAVIASCFDPIGSLKAATSMSAAAWGLVLFLSLFCTSLAFIAMTWGIKHTSASRTSLLLGTEPIWATLIAIVLGGETIGVVGVLGAAITIGATYWGQGIEAQHRLSSAAA